jgi:hypothetical protein
MGIVLMTWYDLVLGGNTTSDESDKKVKGTFLGKVT